MPEPETPETGIRVHPDGSTSTEPAALTPTQRQAAEVISTVFDLVRSNSAPVPALPVEPGPDFAQEVADALGLAELPEKAVKVIEAQLKELEREAKHETERLEEMVADLKQAEAEDLRATQRLDDVLEQLHQLHEPPHTVDVSLCQHPWCLEANR